MKFNEWEIKLKELVEKTKPLLVDEEILSEQATIGNDTFTVYLGDELVIKQNGKLVGDWEMRKAYSTKEKGWQSILGGLKTKVTLAESLNPKLIEAIVQPYIKEAVMDRMVGNDDSPDNEALIRKAVSRRITKLEHLFPTGLNITAVFTLESPSSNYELVINYPNIQYGELWGNARTSRNAGLKNCWSFLQHYEQIEATVREFAETFRPVVKLLKKEE